MKEEQKTTLVHAINHFGMEGQINKAVEEMGKLIAELSRRNLSRFDKDGVAEEVADALIMLEQLRIIFGASKVDSYIAEKLERLEKTINGDLRRQERMMPKGGVELLNEEKSEARKESLVGECIAARLTAGLKSIDQDMAEMIAKWAKESMIAFSPLVKETQKRPESAEIRRCCILCKHIRGSALSPYCGITLQDIIGEPRATCCGLFEPTTEKEDGTNE